jgi:YggT family protein
MLGFELVDCTTPVRCVISMFFAVLTFCIIARALLSWFISPMSDNPIMRILVDITEPVLAPIRRVMPTIAMMDLSPLVAWLAILALNSLIMRVLIDAGL